MTDKDRAFEEWWTTSAPLQPMTPTAFDAGWDAHAGRVKPLIEAYRLLRENELVETSAEWTIESRETFRKAGDYLDALSTDHEAERERQSDHYASCLAPLMDAVRQFLEAWDSRADVNDHVERIRKAMKGERGAADVSHKDDQRSV